MFDSSFPLPQTWLEESSQPDLAAAAEEAFGRRPWQDRDWPGNVDTGVSPRDKRNFQGTYPVPDYGTTAPRHRIVYGQVQYHRDDVEVIQVTPTVMTPETARAYINALWTDPRLPFVAAHTFPSIALNDAAGYFTVGGPALAVPVHNPPRPKPVSPRRGGRGNYAAMPEPVDLTALKPLSVEVSNPAGLDDSDFAWATRHHRDLGPDDIITGTMHLRDITALEYTTSGRVPGGGGGETFQVKLMGPGGSLGYFDDAAAAHAALADAVASRQYRDRDHLDDFTWAEHFADDYSIVPCLVKDGQEATGKLTSRLTAARATVYVEVTTVKSKPALPVTGWMMSWHTADWHRNNIWVDLNPDADGPRLRRCETWI